MSATVTTRGDRELALRFETFPLRAKQKIQERITSLTDALLARIEAQTPVRTGKLRSEERAKVYSESERVAGYVSVYAPGDNKEYPKAATLEYGSTKARRIFKRQNGVAVRIGLNRRRIVARMTKPVSIQARRFLRGPFEDMRPEIEAQLSAALDEAAAEDV